MNEISEILKSIDITRRTAPRGIHSELHELVDKLRKDFGETAESGVGSFGYYLGLLKRVQISTIYRWVGDIRESPKLNTPMARCKVFWWKYHHWAGMNKPNVSRETKLSPTIPIYHVDNKKNNN